MITINSLTKIYNQNQDNEYKALDGINVSLPNKGLVIITGHSGSGKTTFLNILAGLDKQTTGTISENLNGKSLMVFQDFQLINYLTVYENLLLTKKIFKSNINLDSFMMQYGLSDFKNHYPNQISGGQQQRVAIARAVLSGKPIMLCDEPTGNLDIENSKMIAKILADEAKSHLVVVVSHDYEIFKDYYHLHIDFENGIIKCASEDLKNKDTMMCDVNSTLSFKLSLWLSFKMIMKKKTKYILFGISMVLSLILIALSITGVLTSRADVIIKNGKEYGLNQIELFKNNSAFSEASNVLSSSNDDLEEYIAAGARKVMYNPQIKINNEYVRYAYFSNSEKLGPNEVYLSDYLIDTTSLAINDSIKIGDVEFKIAGAYKTNYQSVENLQFKMGSIFSNSTNSYSSILINEDDYKKAIIGDSFYLNSNELPEFCKITKDDNYELENNEIIISTALATYMFGSSENLVGKEIVLNLYNTIDSYMTTKTDYQERTYVIKSVIAFSANVIYTAEEEYQYLAYNYSNTLNSYAKYGVSVSIDDISLIKRIYNDGFTDAMAISDEISNDLSWYKTLMYLMLSVGCVLLIISTAIMISFVNSLIDKEKRTLGILISFGISKIKSLATYLLGFYLAIIVSLIISLVASFGFVYLINYFIMTNRITTFACLAYKWEMIIILVLALVLVTGLITLVYARKIHKKQIVDIVYER